MQGQGQTAANLYAQSYAPLQAKYVQEAQDWGNETNQGYAASQAQAGVAQQFNQARDASVQQLESYGVKPSDTRMAALDIGARTGQAAAEAGAGTKAASDRVMQGMQLQQGAIGQGLQTAGLANQDWTGAAAMTNQQLNNSLQTTGSGAQTMGTGLGWTGAANPMLTATGTLMNQQYQNEIEKYKAEQSASSGTGALIGGALGLATKLIPSFAQGGGVPPDQTQGGAIPMQASPTNGSAVDDVPAALTVGEFVVPKDVTSWLGEKHLQQQIQKARQEKQQAQAKPEVHAAIPQAPTFASRPQQPQPQGALPPG
jgi:hypothetical protein